MTLSAGAKLGPYVIQSPLGLGGMGEVYRARDIRLGRDVAIKVLRESVATDTDRLRRFQQEARAVATLNHPNIVALFDVGERDSSPYLVSELLEGETLRDRIRAGPLPSRRAIEYALQIAEGLAAAHTKGVVHRDLKPENVFITKDHRVKILDFGLAKLASAEAQQAAAAEGLSAAGMTQTIPGLIVGTAGYMSPEQIRGDEVDARTDIFNLGVILYEALSGQRAFRGDTPVETMNAILTEDPPEFDRDSVRVLPGLERIVRRCLVKSREQRFQSAKDLAFALEAESGNSHSGTPQMTATRRSESWGVIAAVVGLLLISTIAAYVAGVRHVSPPAGFERLTFQRGYIKGARFARDGQNIIYSAAWEGRPYEVFTLRIGDRHSRSLGLADAMVVGLSDSGEPAVLTKVQRARMTNWMQFGTLSRAPATGGAAREILEDVWDADMSRDGEQFAVVRAPAGPQQLEYPIDKVLFKTRGYVSHPRISPDGRRVAFLEHPVWGDDRGYVTVVDAKGQATRLTNEAESIQGITWSQDGHEIWYAATSEDLSQERMVFAVTPGGKPRPVFHVPGDCVVWDTAPNGGLLFSHESLIGAQMAASPANSPERNVSVLGFGVFGAISADDKAIAFTEAGHGVPSDYLVFFRRFNSSAAINLGTGTVLGITPDSKYVVAEIPSQPTKLRVLPTGAGEAHTIDVSPLQVDREYVTWMSGGEEFVFQGVDATGLPRGYRIPLQGGLARPLTNGTGAQFWNQVSPDGKLVLQKLAIGTDNGGQAVVTDLSSGQSRPAPLLEGEYPAGWHQDGRQIFVIREEDVGASIFLADVFTGRREVWKQIRHTDPAGVLSMSRFFVTPFGTAYTYSVGRTMSNLYLYSAK